MTYAPCPVKDAKYSSGVMLRIVSASCFKSYIIHSFLSLSHSFPKEIGEEMKRREEERERERGTDKQKKGEEMKRRRDKMRQAGKERENEREGEKKRGRDRNTIGRK